MGLAGGMDKTPRVGFWLKSPLKNASRAVLLVLFLSSSALLHRTSVARLVNTHATSPEGDGRVLMTSRALAGALSLSREAQKERVFQR